ncbi:WD repeat-containing protein [Ceratobasidium sp. AG-Ba]|nr:WD repeat-containing protein [Ceratobasidium sp. AG-Ba]QRW07594.1 WD repeat-containing protein [Ceratobasidium sp. AG-Ba]
MSDKLSVGSKRFKLFHRSSIVLDLTQDNHALARELNSVGTATKGSQTSSTAAGPRPLLKSDLGHHGWTKLTRLCQILNQSAQAFGPLKSALDVVTKGVELFETELKDYDEYFLLKVELESLFSDLSDYFSGPSPPMMTNVILRVTQGLEKEMGLILEKTKQKKSVGYLDTETHDDEVRNCYRRIQSLLRRLALNMDMNILEILDEQSTEARLNKLPNSPGAVYMSAQSDNLGRGECTPNTRAQVLQQMHNWAYDAQAPWVYWLNGMAGTGKTTIAYSLCTQLDRTRKLAASFFCSRQLPECRDVNRIIPSIAYQLSLFSRPFRCALSEILREDPQAYNRPLAVQFEQLILEPLEASKDFPTDRIVVIDALDECEDKNSVDRLLNIILKKAQGIPIKFFLTSRPEAKILDRMRSSQDRENHNELKLHELEQTTVEDDIRTYLSFELRSMNLSRAQLQALVQQSGVLFIYAATVARYISGDNFSSSVDRLDEILRIHAPSPTDANREIDALYTTILNSAFGDSSSNTLDRTRMEMLLRTVVCAQEPLDLDAIAGLTRLDIERAVRPRLRPLMSILHVSESTGVVTILHESFSDYLLTSSRSGQFYCDPEVHHAQMARMCFDTIEIPDPPFNVCSLDSSYLCDEDTPGIEGKVNSAISGALCYSCRHWGMHIISGEPSLDLANRLERFLLGARSLYWGTQVVAPSDVAKELAQDALEFITVLSSSNILKSTLHIYISGLTFWPKQRPIWRHYSHFLAGFVSISGTALELNTSPLIARIETDQEVLCVSYSLDGAYIVSGHSNGSVCMWDAHTSERIGDPFKGHNKVVNSVVFSPHGPYIASGSDDKTTRIWDAQTGRRVGQSLKGHTDGVLSVAYSPDGARIASGSWDRTIRLWCAYTGQQIGLPLIGHVGSVQSVAYSPNGVYIISGSSDKTVRIWEAKTGQLAVSPLIGHSNWVRSVTYSPDNSRVVSGSWDGTIRVWNAYTGRQIGYPIQGNGHIDVVAYSPDGKSIVSGLEYGDIYTWDATTGQRIGRLRERDGYTSVRSIAYSPDGTRIVSCSEEISNIFIWNAQGGRCTMASREEYVPSFSTIAYSPDGTRIYSSSDEDMTVCMWDTQTGQHIDRPFEGHADVILSVACSPDGTHIASGSVDRTIIIWDANTGLQLGRPLEGHTDSVLSLAFSPDALHIASGSSDKTIRQWHAYKGQQVGLPLSAHEDFVRSVTYSPCGSRIASGSGDFTLRTWDANTGHPISQPFRGHTDHVYSVRYSVDGTRIISGSGDKTVRIWNAFTGEQIGLALEGHNGDVYSVAYAPDFSYIVSGSFDNTIRIWDAQTGRPMGIPLEGHTDSVRSVVFSPCGRRVASGSNDGTIRIWDISKTQITVHPHLSADACCLPPHAHTVEGEYPQLCPKYSDFEVIDNHCGNEKDAGSDNWFLRSDGWVVGDQGRLLCWVPADLRSQVMRPQNTLLISPRGWLHIDFSSTRFGDGWLNCYSGQSPN